ncbi:hypothetical protein [Streptomyces sp. NPDC089919]|uniref:hypothetical protein n=1 Tax=Streptomyces sp. NPDC089919 TaxID=3155188 RepID=UPI00343A97BB
MTRSASVLSLLRRRPELARTAVGVFDFDVDRTEHVEEVRPASGAPLRAVAGDAGGGTYFVCDDGAVLYASSEGEAGLLGADLAEALEILFGLPGWRDCTDLDPEADDRTVADALRRARAEASGASGPDLDAARTALLDGLGLRRLPERELLRRLQESLLRTEPEFLLLHAEEGCAYEPLGGLRRPPLWEAVLAPGRADLARMRADHGTCEAIAGDPVRRATALRAAQYDRRPADLPLLRVLLRAEAGSSATEELRIAAVLVALHGEAPDHAFLQSLREDDLDVRFLLGGFPESAGSLAAWAAEFDESDYGLDPRDEYDLTWTALARRQGRTELARAALIRLLDEAGPRDEALLGALAGEFADLGDLGQAVRARRLHASLQDDPARRGASLLHLATLQRRHGEVEPAWRSLQRALTALDGPGPQPCTAHPTPADAPTEPPCHPLTWRALGLGIQVAEECFLVAQDALRTDRHDLGQEALTTATALLDSLPRPTPSLRRAAATTQALATGGEAVGRPDPA